MHVVAAGFEAQPMGGQAGVKTCEPDELMAKSSCGPHHCIRPVDISGRVIHT